MDVHALVLAAIVVLGVAMIVGVAAERLRIPYIVALLLVTLPLPPLQSDQTFVQSFLVVLLPTLIFEAAWNLNLPELVRTWIPMSFMALPGVFVTVAVVGGGLVLAGVMPLLPALLLGAIVAPTDPIAVIGTFRRLHVPSPLVAIVEGEALFNDGVSVVLFSAFALALTGGGAVRPLTVAGNIVLVAVGGAAIGCVVAALVFAVARWAADRDLHVIATVIVAYGAYLGADAAHVSGIFGALTGGVLYRVLERRRNDEPTSERVNTFWSIAAFFANTLVFMTVGARIQFWRVIEHPGGLAITLGLVIASRLALVYGILPLLGVKKRAWQHVIALSGIRGGICIALALSLPEGTPFREDILDAVYGVVAVTIFVQGLALAPVMRRLRL
jgi:monovalent cation:H+ antiporter, CPA1 family